VESFFQGANDLLEVEVNRIQEILKDKLLRVSELEGRMKVCETQIQENAVNIRNQQKEYERYSEQIRSVERDLR
jgi:chromosome segregation ATPase